HKIKSARALLNFLGVCAFFNDLVFVHIGSPVETLAARLPRWSDRVVFVFFACLRVVTRDALLDRRLVRVGDFYPASCALNCRRRSGDTLPDRGQLAVHWLGKWELVTREILWVVAVVPEKTFAVFPPINLV